MLEEFHYKLPLDKGKKAFDFMDFTQEQIQYMRENMTTALPPNMYKRLLSNVPNDCEDYTEGKILEFEGFKLKNKFPQNIALMKDGSFVFCKEFILPVGHTTPVIYGYKFNLVSELFIIYLCNIYI